MVLYLGSSDPLRGIFPLSKLIFLNFSTVTRSKGHSRWPTLASILFFCWIPQPTSIFQCQAYLRNTTYWLLPKINYLTCHSYFQGQNSNPHLKTKINFNQFPFSTSIQNRNKLQRLNWGKPKNKKGQKGVVCGGLGRARQNENKRKNPTISPACSSHKPSLWLERSTWPSSEKFQSISTGETTEILKMTTIGK